MISKSDSSTTTKQLRPATTKPPGPAAGGFFEIHLPENWGTIRLWAEQQQVNDNGYDHYILRFNDPTQTSEPPKPLEGNQIVQERFGQDIKETNAVTVCSGNVEQTLEPLVRPQPKETVKIQWNEYSYDPFPETNKTITEQQQQQESVPDQHQSSRHFEETLRRRG